MGRQLGQEFRLSLSLPLAAYVEPGKTTLLAGYLVGLTEETGVHTILEQGNTLTCSNMFFLTREHVAGGQITKY